MHTFETNATIVHAVDIADEQYVGVSVLTDGGHKVKIMISRYRSCCENFGVECHAKGYIMPLGSLVGKRLKKLDYGMDNLQVPFNVAPTPAEIAEREREDAMGDDDERSDDDRGAPPDMVVPKEDEYGEVFWKMHQGGSVTVRFHFDDGKVIHVSAFNRHNGYYPHRYVIEWPGHVDRDCL